MCHKIIGASRNWSKFILAYVFFACKKQLLTFCKAKCWARKILQNGNQSKMQTPFAKHGGYTTIIVDALVLRTNAAGHWCLRHNCAKRHWFFGQLDTYGLMPKCILIKQMPQNRHCVLIMLKNSEKKNKTLKTSFLNSLFGKM